MRTILIYSFIFLLLATYSSHAQRTDSSHAYKNIIRYNLSGALLFGTSHYVVFGYERLITRKQSISVNFGRASLPKLVSISTDSFETKSEHKRSGYNFSIDYRFYLATENKHKAPHGLYIGPYYSYNRFTNDIDWTYKNNNANSDIRCSTRFNINTIGFELGYQFIFWKRVALDLVLAGPGFGIYDYKATFNGNIDAATKEQIVEGLKQLLTQKFPGMNYVFSDKEINADGIMRTNTIGYRYIIHVGFNF